MQEIQEIIVIEHQLIVTDDKGCLTYPLDRNYTIGKYCRMCIRLYTTSVMLAPHHATLVKLGEMNYFRYQLIKSFSVDDEDKYKLLVNGKLIQTYDLNDGDMIEFAPGVSATYRCFHRVETVSEDSFRGCININFWNLD
ncbi:FHA domain-containing protein [Anabaena catenula]|uniref:FHA domain-containing protein n=1 Tax=Anabaena catenula FACHB-362 TaxID=2692877 RepID=A0ABR8J1S6_9NOST|nr:FHA domain-containing protein [Anabaena catenula]MBD2692273.1 FHA domain-containing protein [Anabaena catenula FACHB-362]